MIEPAVGTPHWEYNPYQIRHRPLTEQFDGGLHRGNIDTVFYVLQPYSLFGSSFICPINLHTHEAMRPFHSFASSSNNTRVVIDSVIWLSIAKVVKY
jgi:hypothetical protein